MRLFTIGHSNHTAEMLQTLLRRPGVEAVCDVRSHPYSRRHPQFGRERLRDELQAAGIGYVFLGGELGGRSSDPADYVNGRIRYERVALSSAFCAGLARLIEEGSSRAVALLCAENDPLRCHRTLLVARELVREGVMVDHILSDGRIESQDDAESRLLRELGLSAQDMFRSRSEILEEAYRRRSEEVGYQRQESRERSTTPDGSE